MKRTAGLFVLLAAFSGAAGVLLGATSDPAKPLTPGPSSGMSPLRVLFIGNSQMSQYDLPQMIKLLSESAPAERPRIQIGRSIVGGSSLKTQWAAGEGPGTARAMIASNGWDYVVLQDIYAHFGNRPTAREFDDYAGRFDDAIKGSGSKTIILATATVTEFTIRSYRYPDAFRELNDIQVAFGQKRGIPVAAAGYAWMKYLGPDPTVEQRLDLYDKDKGHPGPKGTYLYACLLYAVLTGHSPEGLVHEFRSIRGGISIPAVEALKMQRVAFEQYLEDRKARK